MSFLLTAAGGFLVGLLVFFILPFVGAATGWGGPAKAMFLLASAPIQRLAVVVSENNDVLAKPMEYDALGVERIKLDGTPKAFEDPAGRLHSWLGMRFALADEETGTLFAPQDAAIGECKRTYDERGEAAFNATNAEWETHEVQKWVPGAFTLPDAYQLVDLSAAAELVDGGERSEYPKRVKELYKHSRDPFSGGMPLLRMLLPVVALVGAFAAVWLLASQFGGGGGGGGSVVSFGTLFAIGADKRAVAKVGGGVLLALALAVGGFVGMLFAFGLFAAIVGAVTFVLGLALLPVAGLVLGRISTAVADVLSGLFFKLGFASYRDPVLVWTATEYEVREFDDLPATAPDPKWYTLFGTRVGFSFEPGPDAFGEAGVTSDRLDSHVPEVATDGGTTNSNVPSQRYDKAPELGPDDYGGFVPSRRDGYGVLTDIALGWWADSADGTKSMRELLQAKEEFGGDEPPVSDKTIMYLTFAGGFVGLALGVALLVL